MMKEISNNTEILQNQKIFSGEQQENLSGIAGESFERETSLPQFKDGDDGNTVGDGPAEIEQEDLPELDHDLPMFDDSGDEPRDPINRSEEEDHPDCNPERDLPDYKGDSDLGSVYQSERGENSMSPETAGEATEETGGLKNGESPEADVDVNETKPTGGTYGELKDAWRGELEKEPPHEVHHMPANDINGLNVNDGPAIIMDKADHRQTASCGNSLDAREYRAKQEALIKEGKFEEAMQMDIDDIHEKFGDKYDDAIAHMKEKAREKGLI